MKEWFKGFVKDHGDRLFFMGVTTAFGFIFLYIGITIEGLKELTGAGVTLLIAVATLALNKARSKQNGTEPKPQTR